MTRRARCSAYFLCLPILAVAARAQLTSVAGDQAQPIPGAGHDYIHMLSETVNPADGALSVRIEVPVPQGRGISVPFGFGYDSNAAHHFPAPQFATAADNPGYLSKGGWAYLVPQLNLMPSNLDAFQIRGITTWQRGGDPNLGGAPYDPGAAFRIAVEDYKQDVQNDPK